MAKKFKVVEIEFDTDDDDGVQVIVETPKSVKFQIGQWEPKEAAEVGERVLALVIPALSAFENDAEMEDHGKVSQALGRFVDILAKGGNIGYFIDKCRPILKFESEGGEFVSLTKSQLDVLFAGDLAALLKLIVEVLQFNLKSFFSEAGKRGVRMPRLKAS